MVGLAADIAGIRSALSSGKSDSVKQEAKSETGPIQQSAGPSPIQNTTTISGDDNTVIIEDRAEVEGALAFFNSSLSSVSDWEFSNGLKTDGGIISYVGNGQTALDLTKQKFSQTNAYIVTFVPISSSPDLVLRVENSFDIRFGDGGPDEVALYKFAREGNWPPVPLANPNADRKTRWQLPCWLIPGNAVTITINVKATGDFHKDVTLLYEYQCKEGKGITPQDAGFSSAFWSFTVPQATNLPAKFGVGINDPDGKDKASLEIQSVIIENQ